MPVEIDETSKEDNELELVKTIPSAGVWCKLPIKEVESRECIASDTQLERQERINRAGQLLALVRGQQINSGHDHEYAAEAAPILEAIDDVCPEWSNEVFNLGLYESGYLDRYRHGDYRRRLSSTSECPAGWINTSRGCYSRIACEPGSQNCVPTSCSYWQIRSIYPGRPSCTEIVRNEDVAIEWACDWVSNNWPNVAAYNAGPAGARLGRAQPYANRVYIGVELLSGRGDLSNWHFSRRRFIHDD